MIARTGSLLIAALLVCLPLAAQALELRGAIAAVEAGDQVRIALPAGAAVAAGDEVRIEAELPGVGSVPIETRWRIKETGTGFAIADPEGAPTGHPQVGYTAIIVTTPSQASVSPPVGDTPPLGDIPKEPEVPLQADDTPKKPEVPPQTDETPRKAEIPLQACDRLVAAGLYAKAVKASDFLRLLAEGKGLSLSKGLPADIAAMGEMMNYFEQVRREWRDAFKGSRLLGIDHEQAIEACRSAVREFPQVPRFQVRLARAYAEAGKSKEALTLYLKLAPMGHAGAMNDLAVLYADGLVLARDEAEAHRLFRAAADKGSAAALTNLAMMFGGGHGVEKDAMENRRLIKKAIEKVDPWAIIIADITDVVDLYGADSDSLKIRAYCGLAETEPAFATMIVARAAKAFGPQDRVKLARCLLRAAKEAGSSANLLVTAVAGDLADDDDTGHEVARKMLQLLCQAAETGNTLALYFLWDSGVAKIATKAESPFTHCLRRAAEKGGRVAMLFTALSYEAGRGITKDQQEAVRWYKKAALNQSVAAMMRLGAAYSDGLGVPQDDAEAIRLYEKALSALPRWMKSDRQLIKYSIKTLRARGVHECDRLAAHSHDSDAVAPGVDYKDLDAPAVVKACETAVKEQPDILRFQTQLGVGLLKAGRNAEALRVLREAAQRGNAHSMAYIGMIYKIGDAVKKDPAEALYWLEKAAEKGNVAGMVFAAGMYRRGEGAARSPGMAAKWYQKAADMGNMDSMADLSLMYDGGVGVEQDLTKAAGLMLKAYRKNSGKAKRILLKEPNTLSLAARKEIQKRLRDAGHYDGAIDGRFGPGTKRAIEALAKK